MQNSNVYQDEHWMRYALALAHRAEEAGEVPVGAVLVKEGKNIADGWNQPIAAHDPTAHAEIVVLRKAGVILENYRVPETTLYVTLEPCAMCVGAIAHARIERLVFGCADPHRGAVCSALSLADADFLNHRVVWQGGVLAEPCSSLLKSFFKRRR